MSTPFSDIYIKANILFDDASLLSDLTDDEYSELLELFLSNSTSIQFKSCKKDLSDIDNIKKQFNETLSNEEQWIIAYGIRFLWFERKIFKEENLRNRMTTKDYQIHSPANLIDKLTILRDKAEKDLKNKIIDYSFNGFDGFK